MNEFASRRAARMQRRAERQSAKEKEDKAIELPEVVVTPDTTPVPAKGISDTSPDELMTDAAMRNDRAASAPSDQPQVISAVHGAPAVPTTKPNAEPTTEPNTPTMPLRAVPDIQNPAAPYNKGVSDASADEMVDHMDKTPNRSPAPDNQENGREAIFKALFQGKMQTPEQKEKALKRERTRAIITAIGDGLSALSNLYDTTQGAVSTPDRSSMSEANRKRFEHTMALRKQEENRYLDMLYQSRMGDLADAMAAKFNKADNDTKLAIKNMELSYNEAADQAKRKAEEVKQVRDQLFNAQENASDRTSREKIAESGNRTRIAVANIGQSGQNTRQQRGFEHEDAAGGKDSFVYDFGGMTYHTGAKALEENRGNIAQAIISEVAQITDTKAPLSKQDQDRLTSLTTTLSSSLSSKDDLHTAITGALEILAKYDTTGNGQAFQTLKNISKSHGGKARTAPTTSSQQKQNNIKDGYYIDAWGRAVSIKKPSSEPNDELYEGSGIIN